MASIVLQLRIETSKAAKASAGELTSLALQWLQRLRFMDILLMCETSLNQLS
jgi:hypothetical protein